MIGRIRKDALQSRRKALKSMLLAMMESSELHKANKELSPRLIRKNLRLENPEVIEAAYEDGVTTSYPYFTERQFQVSLELLGKSMGQPASLNYKQVVDHSLLDEIGHAGTNRSQLKKREAGLTLFSWLN